MLLSNSECHPNPPCGWSQVRSTWFLESGSGALSNVLMVTSHPRGDFSGPQDQTGLAPVLIMIQVTVGWRLRENFIFSLIGSGRRLVFLPVYPFFSGLCYKGSNRNPSCICSRASQVSFSGLLIAHPPSPIVPPVGPWQISTHPCYQRQYWLSTVIWYYHKLKVGS